MGLIVRIAVYLVVFAAGCGTGWHYAVAWVRAGNGPYEEVYRLGWVRGRLRLGMRSDPLSAGLVDEVIEDVVRVDVEEGVGRD